MPRVFKSHVIEIRHLLGMEFGEVPPAFLVDQLVDECDHSGCDSLELIDQIIRGGTKLLSGKYGVTEWPSGVSRHSHACPPAVKESPTTFPISATVAAKTTARPHSRKSFQSGAMVKK